ncbi:MAG: PP2C family protein-serine/threonine phosphatase [Candidatus Korobacteraceae bacterium]|jgi:serine phosphatase RsbU (regulator of sigma subunit)
MKLPFQRERVVAPGPATAADFPPLSGADIAGMVQGQRVGGDFYGFLRANHSRVVFGLLDVAGSHAENQAIVEAARQTFHELGCKSFADPEVNEADAMMEFCLELNLTIRRAASGVRSCPAFIGCYNEALGTVCYANAGHTPGLLRDPSGVSELPATGLPLGLFAASTYEAPFAALQPGASLLLVSRGVVEAAYKKEEFGLQRVKEQFQRASRENAREIASGILTGVQEFLRMPPTHNDVTALALVRAEPTPVAAGV